MNQKKNLIPYGRHEITTDDISSVTEVLNSEFLTQGPVVQHFEDALTRYCKVNHAVAVNSATSALHMACLAIDIGPGDYVWTSPITFVASANCVLYCNAKVDFIDVDPFTYNISIVKLVEKLEQAKILGILPKAIIPVHLAGQSCDMRSIYELSKKYSFKIIEDASHAIGAKYENEAIGNCRYSDITVFSFHPVKIITTGEGGAAVTNNNDLFLKLIRIRSHGITSDNAFMVPRPSDELWNYQQIGLGFNYRLTDIQAALGLSQIKRLDKYVSRRHEIADYYNKRLANLPLNLPYQIEDSYSSYHLYIIKIAKIYEKKSQKQVYCELRKEGILVNLHYIPVYLQPYYEGLGFKRGYCPEAESYFKKAISLPIFPTMTESQQDQIISTLEMILLK